MNCNNLLWYVLITKLFYSFVIVYLESVRNYIAFFAYGLLSD